MLQTASHGSFPYVSLTIADNCYFVSPAAFQQVKLMKPRKYITCIGEFEGNTSSSLHWETLDIFQ